jgi:hypothetical protein
MIVGQSRATLHGSDSERRSVVLRSSGDLPRADDVGDIEGALRCTLVQRLHRELASEPAGGPHDRTRRRLASRIAARQCGVDVVNMR